MADLLDQREAGRRPDQQEARHVERIERLDQQPDPRLLQPPGGVGQVLPDRRPLLVVADVVPVQPDQAVDLLHVERGGVLERRGDALLELAAAARVVGEG